MSETRHINVRLARMVAVLSGAIMAVLMLSTGVSVAGTAQTCANEAVRTQQGSASLALPDCRAYEMVSPWGSVPLRGEASDDGERFGYDSSYPYPNAEGESLDWLSVRGAQGWSTKGMAPPQGGVQTSDSRACDPSVFYSADLTLSLLTDGWQEKGEPTVCEGDVPALVPGEPRDFANVFLHEEDGTYTLLDMPPEGVAPANAIMQDATPDLSHVIFSEETQLTAVAPSHLYEWAQGSLRSVAFLPNGTPVLGTLANGGGGYGYIGDARLYNQAAYFTHAMSADGERVFFYAEGKLYVRLNATREPTANGECSATEAKACTVEVDAPEPGAAGPGGDGVFVDASTDGSRVFFMDENRLTSNATAVAKEPDLYEYDIETGSLTDLTATAGEPANVRGFSGASEDGSYIYFVALGALTGAQQNGTGAAAVGGEPNLYVYHAGATTFIATLKAATVRAENDTGDWEEGGSANSGYLQTAVSPDGLFIAFNSYNRLTGYDNESVEAKQCGEGGCREIFLYGVREASLRCVSCMADGERPVGSAEIRGPQELERYEGGPKVLARYLDDAGRLFFEAPGALLPAVTDGAVNVYEYESGVLNLISSGTAQGASKFLDASVSGNDVFFATGQSLVQADTDNQFSLYDARVNGGFMTQSSSGEGGGAGACEDVEACRPPLGEPPVEAFPASAAFSGPGDLPVVPEGPSSKKGQEPRSLTRSERLVRALAACSKKPKRKRRSCRARARRRFGDHPAQRKSGARHKHTTSKHRTNRRAGR